VHSKSYNYGGYWTRNSDGARVLEDSNRLAVCCLTSLAVQDVPPPPSPAAPRLGVINGPGAFYVKEGALDAPWTLEVGNADAQAIAMSGDRLGVITGCGAFYVKEGGLDAPWVLEVGPGDAKAIALSGNRIGVINGANAFYVKEGGLGAPWVREIGDGDAQFICLLDSCMRALDERATYPDSSPPDQFPDDLEHGRTVSLALSGSLIAEGNVITTDGYLGCAERVPVRVQKRSEGIWKLL
jgi:hypothetical protein